MRLTLNVLRCPDAAAPESRSSQGGDIAIGRGLENDWVLEDPDRVLSKRHCVLEFRGGYWQVRDSSTNGTFLNGAAEPVGRGLVAPVSDGDRLRFGPYEVEIRIAADAAPAWPAGGAASAAAGPRSALPGTADHAPWGEAAIGSSHGPGRPAADPFADPLSPPPASGMGSAALPGGAGGLPADWDPLADLAPMPDHTPAASDAFTPPRPVTLPPASAIPPDWDPFGDTPPGAAAPPRNPGTAAGSNLPSDWDPMADLAPATIPVSPQADRTPSGQGEQGLPASTAAAAPPPPPAPVPAEALGDPFAEEGVPSHPIPHLPPAMPAAGREAEEPWTTASAPASPSPSPSPSPWPAAAAGLPAAPTPPPAAAVPLPAAAAGGGEGEALAALLRGAGLAPAAIGAAAQGNPLAVIEQAGAALRAAVAGLRALLIARADVKREFRIEQTMLRSIGNNPLKFAATDEMATGALLSGAGVRAVAETVHDLTAHEVAALAATQAAARALLTRLAPEGLEQADTGGGLFGAREKRLWEAYRTLHGKVTEQFEDDFDSAFGKEFARAYEQAVTSRAGLGEDGGRDG